MLHTWRISPSAGILSPISPRESPRYHFSTFFSPPALREEGRKPGSSCKAGKGGGAKEMGILRTQAGPVRYERSCTRDPFLPSAVRPTGHRVIAVVAVVVVVVVTFISLRRKK